MLFTSSRLPLILAIVAGIAMVTVTAWQGVRFWQNDTDTTSSAVSAAGPDVTAQSQRAPDIRLATLELFGKPGAAATETEPDTENLPETNLQLFLRGVLSASGEFPGSALIEDNKSQTEVYLVGDELPGDARLRKVHANRVIIEREGKLENLYFPEDEDRSGLSMASSDDEEPAAPTGDTEVRPVSTDQSSPPGTAADSDQRREEIRRRLEQLRERLRNNN